MLKDMYHISLSLVSFFFFNPGKSHSFLHLISLKGRTMVGGRREMGREEEGSVNRKSRTQCIVDSLTVILTFSVYFKAR